MTRAVSDCRCTFGDGDLLSSPDCGSRHPLGRCQPQSVLLSLWKRNLAQHHLVLSIRIPRSRAPSMTRAVSDCRCTFGDGDLLSSPDCGSRHPLGRVASSVTSTYPLSTTICPSKPVETEPSTTSSRIEHSHPPSVSTGLEGQIVVDNGYVEVTNTVE
jgi:hypothetical protein